MIASVRGQMRHDSSSSTIIHSGLCSAIMVVSWLTMLTPNVISRFWWEILFSSNYTNLFPHQCPSVAHDDECRKCFFLLATIEFLLDSFAPKRIISIIVVLSNICFPQKMHFSTFLQQLTCIVNAGGGRKNNYNLNSPQHGTREC